MRQFASRITNIVTESFAQHPSWFPASIVYVSVPCGLADGFGIESLFNVVSGDQSYQSPVKLFPEAVAFRCAVKPGQILISGPAFTEMVLMLTVADAIL